MRRLAGLIAAAMLALSGSARGQEPPLTIQAVLPLTGFGAYFGKTQLEGLQAFETMTNRNGGVAGRTLKFVVLDDQSNPQIAVQLFNQLIAQHATAVIGPSFTASCGAVLPLLANGPLTYCLSPGVHPPAGSYMFAANVATTDLTAAKLRYMRAHGWTRIATILTNDASGQDVARQIDGLLAMPEYRDLHVVSHQTFNVTDVSIAAQIANIRAANAQVLLTAATGTPFGTILRSAHDAGLDVPVFASGSNMTPEQMAQYAPFMPNDLLFANPRGVVVERSAPAAVRNAQAAFFAAFVPLGIQPGQGQTIPWDPAALIVDAFRRLGPGAGPSELRRYIATLDHWVGSSGAYDFRKVPQRGIGLDAVVIYRWNPAPGDYTIVSKGGGAL